MTHEPGLDLWLRYVSSRGGLHEEDGDLALVVLPPELQRAFDLPEEVRVTADPEAARDDGAQLIIPGHPLLDQAAAAVLDAGDVGHRHLAWPRSVPPTGQDLLRHAREALDVAHGRLDPAGDPRPAYRPLLRVGVRVDYIVGERFQEREEVWVDAGSGLPLADEVRDRLAAGPWRPEPDTAHPALSADLVFALREADRGLQARAGERERALSRTIQADARAERERASAYYDAVVASIDQRRASAAPERQSLLDAQAEATQMERARRLTEIDEKFRPRHEMRPFRLHLLLVPALHLPLCVRRGERRYPFALTWLLPAAVFAPLRCPHCGAAAPLVAGREALGCEVCLPSPAAPAPAASSRPPAAVAAGPDGRAGTGSRERSASPAPTPPSASERAPSPAARRVAAPAPDPAEAPVDEALAAYRRLRARVSKIGDGLGVEFWQRVIERSPWPSVAPDSPLAALYRLYGVAGPLFAVGLTRLRLPERLSAATDPPDPRGCAATSGQLIASRQDGANPFTLRWRLQGRKAFVYEVLPFPRAETYLPPLASLSPPVLDRLTREVPAPLAEFDPVAATLWRVGLPIDGLPLIVRCLAVWWSAAEVRQTTLLPVPEIALAAALVDRVGRRSGLRRTRAVTAERYGVAAADVTAAVRVLAARLPAGRVVF